ncbi:Hypothetical protein FKW44_009594, partial [Caligus rogercresseyi]
VTIGCWGFKPIANCKNTSKEPLKCHFVHLGPRVPPAGTMGYWGFKPSPLVKIRERNPSNAILCTWVHGFRQPQKWGIGV